MKAKSCQDRVAAALALMLCWDRTHWAIPEIAKIKDAPNPPKRAIVVPAARMPKKLRRLEIVAE